MEVERMGSILVRRIWLVALLSFALPAEGAIKTVVRQCDGCSSVQQLEDEAWAAAGVNIENTTDEILFLVVSDEFPISAYFRLVWSMDYVDGYGWYTYPDMLTETVDEQSVIALENAVFARASKVPPVSVPADIAAGVGQWAAPELLIAYLQTKLIIGAGPLLGPWHGLFTGQYLYFKVQDMRTLTIRDIFIGDTITVVYDDESSEKLEFLGIGPTGASIQWRIVPGSQRNSNGDPVGPSGEPIVSTPVQPGVTLPGGGGGTGGGSVVVRPIQLCRIETYTCMSESWATGIMFSCHREVYQMPC